MKNIIISFFVILLLIISVLGTTGQIENKAENSKFVTILFSQPVIHENEEYASIELTEATSNSWEEGKPVLPVVTEVYTFPFGTHINNVDVSFSNAIQKKISKTIMPAPEPQIVSAYSLSNAIKSDFVGYPEINIYPNERFSYRKGTGLKDGQHVLFLTVNLNPIQYKPNENTIYYTQKATINIRYTLPEKPLTSPDVYNLLIIAPSEFSNSLQSLVDYKETAGISTKLVTLDDIYSGTYFPVQGKDNPEKIKYFIKDAIENWGIKYVLLVGAGLKDEEKFPVRYAWIQSWDYEYSFPSDLYYADIYNSEGGFSSWDADGDGRYAEYNSQSDNDMSAVDFYPDVYLGKLPCNNFAEVYVIVQKIINYGKNNKMTHKIVQMGSDTFPKQFGDNSGIYEGEYANEKVLEKLPGYSTTQLWGSNEKLTKYNIVLGFMSGVDFADFSGHGWYWIWANYAPNDNSTWLPMAVPISNNSGWLNEDFKLLLVTNKKLPVVFYNGCATNKYTEVDDCLGWETLSHPTGGGIASFAASGTAYGAPGSLETERYLGWMEVHTFDELYKTKKLGDAWNNCIVDYYNTFQSSLDYPDYKTLLEYSMFGDPTLKIQDGTDVNNHDVSIESRTFNLQKISNAHQYVQQILPRLAPRILQLLQLLQQVKALVD